MQNNLLKNGSNIVNSKNNVPLFIDKKIIMKKFSYN